MNKNTTKRSLLASVLALALCVIMLVGTTFAWFTDTASTGVNKIQAGNLKVDIVDKDGNSLDGETLKWVKAAGHEDEEVLWEPGAEYALTPFKIVNKGNLALKYEVTVNGVDGSSKLLEAIDFTVKAGERVFNINGWDGILLPADKTATSAEEEIGETGFITISGKMRTDAGNEYQGLSIDGISITVVATQYTYENDSNGNQYDKDAKAEINVNASNIQDYLDGKYGSINGMTLVLAEGDYDTLELGRATAYDGSNTEYWYQNNDRYTSGQGSIGEYVRYNTVDEFKNTVTTSSTGAIKYVRNLNNITFKAADDAAVNIAGVTMKSGHIYGTEEVSVHDYVMNRDTNSTVHSYNLVHHVNGLKFEGLNFTGMVNINGALSETKIDGVSFEKCTFTSSDKTVVTNKGIDISSEGGVAAMSGVTVRNCKFSNVFQGVYTRGIRNVSVTDSNFNGTTHNAIAIQDEAVFNHGAVVIKNNEFAAIGDRVIRFHWVGADTQITIQNNTVTDGGNPNEQCMKADSLAEGITYAISGNNWSGFKPAGNTELADK